MMDKKLWLLVILVIVGLTACATRQSVVKGPPLPNDINIIPPSPDLPKEIAAFSGKWEGTWSHGLHAMLVVEQIGDTWAQVVYSHEDSARYNLSAKYKRRKCKVIPGPMPKLEWIPDEISSKAATIKFELKDSNTLEGDMWVSQLGGSLNVVMKRIK